VLWQKGKCGGPSEYSPGEEESFGVQSNKGGAKMNHLVEVTYKLITKSTYLGALLDSSSPLSYVVVVLFLRFLTMLPGLALNFWDHRSSSGSHQVARIIGLLPHWLLFFNSQMVSLSSKCYLYCNSTRNCLLSIYSASALFLSFIYHLIMLGGPLPQVQSPQPKPPAMILQVLSKMQIRSSYYLV
jgi:hypothetical protein